jgi:bifunctional DNA-binding transcriptional regulator/antitoxin component of YhaV-PrlF toxin-antitoxin module
MTKVTSKLQVTIPKALAERHTIRPGDEITWQSAGDVIRVVPQSTATPPDRETRLHLFDQASERQRRRDRARTRARGGKARGWTREELYARGRPR